jgi:hypothetical protein
LPKIEQLTSQLFHVYKHFWHALNVPFKIWHQLHRYLARWAFPVSVGGSGLQVGAVDAIFTVSAGWKQDVLNLDFKPKLF